MGQDQTKKEALFNEVKGSLFEFLVARGLAKSGGDELAFLQSLDKNYLNVLSQQDRMVRQFYPEMLGFLEEVTDRTLKALLNHFSTRPTSIRLTGKFMNSIHSEELSEADLIVNIEGRDVPVSLKLNKKNAYVNTKSGGIKSFFLQYFPFLNAKVQEDFNSFVDQEFSRMAHELHAMNDLEYAGHFGEWTKRGHSELPGELKTHERQVLKDYYARIAKRVHALLTEAKRQNPSGFSLALPALMGFSRPEILQVVCFHDFKAEGAPEVFLHSFEELGPFLSRATISPFEEISSVDVRIGDWSLQIRVKPMNKFTTTAVKMNCSVKLMRPSVV